MKLSVFLCNSKNKRVLREESNLTIQLKEKSPFDVIGMFHWVVGSTVPDPMLAVVTVEVIRWIMRTPSIVNEKRDLCPRLWKAV